MSKIIDFGYFGFIEKKMYTANRKFIIPKDYVNKEPKIITIKCDFSKKGGLK